VYEKNWNCIPSSTVDADGTAGVVRAVGNRLEIRNYSPELTTRTYAARGFVSFFESGHCLYAWHHALFSY